MAQVLSRRRFVLGAALTSAAAVLAACGQAPPPTAAPQKPAESKPAAADTKPAEKPAAAPAAAQPAGANQVAITFAAHGNQAEQEFYQKAVAMFNEKHPNIKATFQAEPTNTWEKYLTLMAGGTMYDTFRNEEKRLPEFVHRGEQLLDLTSYSQKDKIDKEDFPPTVWEEFFWKGKMYGFGHDLSPAVIFINRKLWQEKGVELPPTTWGDPKWTWDAFVDRAKKLNSGEGAQRVFGFIGNTWWVYTHPWVWSNGGRTVAEDDMTVTIDQPQTVEAFQFYVDLNDKHKVMPQANEMTEGPAQLFESGRAGMNVNNTSYTIRLRQMNEFDWEMAPFPTGKAGVFTRIPNNCCSAYTKTKDPEAAWEYLKHMASKEVTINARGMPSRISAAKSPEFLNRTPNQNWKLLAEAGAIRKSEPRTPFFGEFDRTFRAAWEGAQNGTHTVPQMVADLKPKLEKILRGES